MVGYKYQNHQLATSFFFDDKTPVRAGICADTIKHVGLELDQQTSLEN